MCRAGHSHHLVGDVLMASLTGKTLQEAALNPDGVTYHGPTALRWIFEAVTGKELTEEEGRELVAQAQQKARAKLVTEGK